MIASKAYSKLTDLQRETIHQLMITMSKHPSISVYRALANALNYRRGNGRDQGAILDALAFYNKVRKKDATLNRNSQQHLGDQ